MLLKFIDFDRIIAKGTLCYIFDAEVVMQLELRFLYRFGTTHIIIDMIVVNIELSFLPIITNLLWVFSAHSDEGRFGLRFLSKAILGGSEV